MNYSPQNASIVPLQTRPGGCLSCGTPLKMSLRRYCSIECRQYLRRTLNIRTGLLKALNTRFATFYFTPDTVLLDVMPFGAADIFSFIYPRSRRMTPARDFCRMANTLGNAWWAEKRRTNRHYLASRLVLEQARRDAADGETVKPLEIKIPSVRDASLIRLQLGKSVLNSPELFKVIKTAYRRQALKHHPDHGGDASAFMKIHQAYEELLNWAESPSFVRRRGFPDKWFYDSTTNRWVQPTPHRR
ncbi:MAG: J domain-containing protein [Desulfobacterales bacterium]